MRLNRCKYLFSNECDEEVIGDKYILATSNEYATLESHNPS